MKIIRVRGWAMHLPNVEGPYYMSGGKVTTGHDAVVVEVTADDGLVGVGESGTVGVTNDAAFPAGQVAGLGVIAPAVLGLDPRAPQAANRALHARLTGHPYVKAALDMAVWDLAAQSAGVPLWKHLGGDEAGRTRLYRPVQGADAETTVAKAHHRIGQGYARLQVKVGDDPLTDAARVLAVRQAVGPDVVIYADANCGFSLSSARTFVRALGTDGAGILLEQPCATLGDCAALRESWAGPMVMDENIVSLATLLEAHRLGVADGVTIKLTRVGGITPASLMRNVAVELGIHVTVEDASGGDLVTAAFAHMNGSTPAKYRVHSCDFGEWVTLSCINERPARDANMLAPSDRPGLGVSLNHDVLGTPFLDLSMSPAEAGR